MSKSSLFCHRPSPCPQCGEMLVVRQGKYGAFLGCSAYPNCNYQHPLKAISPGHVVKRLTEQHCPLCQAILVLRQGRYGMFICCEHYPDCPHSETLHKADDTTITCPRCSQGHLLMRQSRYGKPFYSCSLYPECRFSVNLPPVAGVCAFCQYPLLLEKHTTRGVQHCCASKQCGKIVSES